MLRLGYNGRRVPPPEPPLRAARRPLAGLHVVVTAGPTREHLDDVRFLSNGSSGRLGIAVADQARRRGARVTLLLGPVALPPPRGVRTVHVVSTDDLLRAARRETRAAAAVVFAAAPADWRPARRRRGKPGKGVGGQVLRLVATPDVAATLGRRKGGRVHVGFALESGRGGLARARAKLERKRFDAVVWNTPENVGAGGGPARWLTPDGGERALPTRPKAALARAVVAGLEGLLRAAKAAPDGHSRRTRRSKSSVRSSRASSDSSTQARSGAGRPR